MSWEQGDPKPSLKNEILELMRADKTKAWDPAQLRAKLYPELEFPSELSGIDAQIEMISIAKATATIESLLEVLVAENKVEKREFRVDQIAEFTINEEEYEQVAEQWEGDVMTNRVFYKAT